MPPRNFKFKYFFSVQIPTENFISPIANLVSCNVVEFNNTSEQKNFLHVLKLQSSSIEIFFVDLDTMLKTIVIDFDDECVPFPKKPKKVIANVNYKFQEIWAMKIPWA